MRYPFLIALILSLVLTLAAAGCSRDTTAPTAPSNIRTTTPCSNPYPAFSWDPAQDDGSGVASYLVRINDGEWIDIGNTTSYSHLAMLADGIHILEVKAVDSAGNEGAPGSLTFAIFYPHNENIIRYDREHLKQGAQVTVPPAGLRIVPIDVAAGETLAGVRYSVAEGGTENYIDIYLKDACWYDIKKPSRSFNGSFWPALAEGTYYLYLDNEFCSTHEKRVRVEVVIGPYSQYESAADELATAKTAIAACLYDAGASEIDGAGFPIAWDGSTGVIKAGTADAGDMIGVLFKAYYYVEQDGTISLGVNVSWPDITWDTATRSWKKSG